MKDHPERAFLQKYELDGMVDRQIKKFRSDAANRLSTETDGYLRKKFEQTTLMNARVVLFSLCLFIVVDRVHAGHIVQHAGHFLSLARHAASHRNRRRSHAVHRAALPDPALREAFSLHSRRRFPSTRRHHSQSHHQTPRIRKIPLRTARSQQIPAAFASNPVPNDALHLSLAQSIRLSKPAHRQQARSPALLLLHLPKLLRAFLRLPRCPRSTSSNSIPSRESAPSTDPVSTIHVKQKSSSISFIDSSSNCLLPPLVIRSA